MDNKWEYLTINEYELFGEDGGFPIEKMNELGKGGWELACMTKGWDEARGTIRVCIFKRELYYS